MGPGGPQFSPTGAHLGMLLGNGHQKSLLAQPQQRAATETHSKGGTEVKIQRHGGWWSTACKKYIITHTDTLVIIKYEQHPELLDRLITTSPLRLIEASTGKRWGGRAPINSPIYNDLDKPLPWIECLRGHFH